VFVLITLLFLDVTGTLHKYFGWLASIQFWPALLALHVGVLALLVVLTLVFGRIYCSIICPLGVMQDVVSRLHGIRKKNRFTYSKEKRWLRYTVLAVFIVSALAGVNAVVSLLAPYSSYGRIAGSLMKPVYEAGNNVLAAIAESVNSYAFYSVDVWLKSLPTLIVASVTLVVIAVLAWRGGRTYCNTICPVGTILSFLARFSWFKVRIDGSKCVNCGLCTKNCKASAIDFKNHKIDYSRCVVCGDCIGKCHKGAISLSSRRADKRTSRQVNKQTSGQADKRTSQNADSANLLVNSSAGVLSTNESRRSFLLGVAVAATGAALAQEKKKVDGGLAAIEDKVAPKRLTPLTPPGSLSAQHFARHCTACQLCVSTCPNGVLRPSTDLSTFMQPTMSYERGYCRPECTKCGKVCPTGAIKPITRAIKSATQIGHAVWVKKNCVPLTDGVECGNCARHCPTGAITMIPLNPKDERSPKIPAVNEARCIGCGACENLCPARPFSAIYVEGHEVHREV
jgi:ferredoxin